MTTLPKMTQEDKDGLIALHMAMRTVDRHSADSALVQSLGKFLLEDACTPDDAADILKAVFDEEADRVSSEVRQSLGINEGDFLEIVGTDRGLLMQKCGEAYGNEPVPKGVETEEKDKIFVFRDQDCMVHLVSLSKKAEELCRWLEDLGLLDEDMWWEVCSDNVEGNF